MVRSMTLLLRSGAGLRSDDRRSLVPQWVPPAFLVCGIVLIPWTALLFVTLPRHYGANHWRFAWGGFDVALALGLAATAVTALRRSPVSEIAATITGTLLVCDAWFDVLTSHGTSAIAQATGEAIFVELPVAAVCFWIARNVAHAMEIAAPYLRAAGFTVEDRKLVPPSGLEVPSGIEGAAGGSDAAGIAAAAPQNPREADRDQRARARADDVHPEVREVAENQIGAE